MRMSGLKKSAPCTRIRLEGHISVGVTKRGPSSVMRKVSQLNAAPTEARQVTAQPLCNSSSAWGSSVSSTGDRPVAQLAGDLALGRAVRDRAARRLDGVADDLAQRPQTGLFVGAQGPAQPLQALADRPAVAERAVAGHLATLA